MAYSVDGSSVAPPGMKEDTFATSVVDSSGSSSVTITCYVIFASTISAISSCIIY